MRKEINVFSGDEREEGANGPHDGSIKKALRTTGQQTCFCDRSYNFSYMELNDLFAFVWRSIKDALFENN